MVHLIVRGRFFEGSQNLASQLKPLPLHGTLAKDATQSTKERSVAIPTRAPSLGIQD